MNFVQQAAEMNEEGATFCAHGDMQNGFLCFRNALRILAGGAEAFEEAAIVPVASNTGFLNKMPTLVLPYSRGAASSHESQPYFVFKDAILFNSSRPLGSLSASHLALFFSVCEFNMALSFHLQSFQVGEKSHLITKASTLYDFCLQHVKHAAGCSEAASVLVAALSNKAQLMNQEFGRYDELEELKKPLLNAVSYCYANPGLFTAQEVEEFLLNIVILKELKFAAAA
ncbi:expressed unknown protein [Seminavis robusta]|uniref:Uncharacterized protein n=1 Tax=Seminavis robusta TaxID=568900 RepID=A0A9N8EHU1_9STRA|nr:expressed unknown protein [Seminavis robusta]|eukprot:Sro959_g224800.1 n/a (228) ;mRNA; f:30232-30915